MRPAQLLTLSLLLLLSACGFHLRGLGSFELSISELELSAADNYSSIAKEVRSRLQGQGVELTSSAEFNLHLGHEQQERRRTSSNLGSYSSEYQLTSSLDYSIRSGSLPPLVSGQVQVQRQLSVSQNQSSASDEEERLLRNEMRDELVMQLMMRLQAIRPEQLQQRKEEELRKQEAFRATERELQLQQPGPAQPF